jgi:hypothetical protein
MNIRDGQGVYRAYSLYRAFKAAGIKGLAQTHFKQRRVAKLRKKKRRMKTKTGGAKKYLKAQLKELAGFKNIPRREEAIKAYRRSAVRHANVGVGGTSALNGALLAAGAPHLAPFAAAPVLMGVGAALKRGKKMQAAKKELLAAKAYNAKHTKKLKRRAVVAGAGLTGVTGLSAYAYARRRRGKKKEANAAFKALSWASRMTGRGAKAAKKAKGGKAADDIMATRAEMKSSRVAHNSKRDTVHDFPAVRGKKGIDEAVQRAQQTPYKLPKGRANTPAGALKNERNEMAARSARFKSTGAREAEAGRGAVRVPPPARAPKKAPEQVAAPKRGGDPTQRTMNMKAVRIPTDPTKQTMNMPALGRQALDRARAQAAASAPTRTSSRASTSASPSARRGSNWTDDAPTPTRPTARVVRRHHSSAAGRRRAKMQVDVHGRVSAVPRKKKMPSGTRSTSKETHMGGDWRAPAALGAAGVGALGGGALIARQILKARRQARNYKNLAMAGGGAGVAGLLAGAAMNKTGSDLSKEAAHVVSKVVKRMNESARAREVLRMANRSEKRDRLLHIGRYKGQARSLTEDSVKDRSRGKKLLALSAAGTLGLATGGAALAPAAAIAALGGGGAALKRYAESAGKMRKAKSYERALRRGKLNFKKPSTKDMLVAYAQAA